MLFNLRQISILLLILILQINPVGADQSRTIMVEPLEAPIIIDGESNDWPAPDGHKDHSHSHKAFTPQDTIPSYTSNPDEMRYNKGWVPKPQFRVGVHNNTLYMLASWQDESADSLYRPWHNMGKRWSKGRIKDDMFAVRFELNGTLAACMLSGETYDVDVWRWTAGRSNPSGYADDMIHKFTTTFRDKASEYHHDGQTIYISTEIDEGTRGWSYTKRPNSLKAQVAPGIAYETPQGSLADVSAKGVWKDGYWTLELSRALKTADKDDVVFQPGSKTSIQFALFNAGYRLRKQITNTLILDFQDIR